MPRSVSEDTRSGALPVKCCSCRRYLGHDIIVQTQDGHFKSFYPVSVVPEKAEVQTRKILSLAVIDHRSLKTAFSSTPGKRQTFSIHSRPAVSLLFGSNLHFNLFGLLCVFCTFAPPPQAPRPKQEIHSLIFNEYSLVGESLDFKGKRGKKKKEKRIFLMKYSAGELQCWENNQQLSRGAGSTGIGRRASAGRRGRAR